MDNYQTHFEIWLVIGTCLALAGMVAYVFYTIGYDKGVQVEARRQMFFSPEEHKQMIVDLSKSDEQLKQEQLERNRLKDLKSFEEQL